MQLTLSEIIEWLERINLNKRSMVAGELRDKLLEAAKELETVARNVIP